MATIRELLIKINGDNSGLGNALRGAGQDLKALQDHAKKTGEVFTNLGKDLTLKVTAPILAFGTAMVMATADAQKVSVQLANAIDAVGMRGKISVASLSAYADELQKLTKYDDEATLGAAEMLISLTALDEKGIKKLIPNVQNLATKFKMDLNQAATLVGKTIGSNTNALGRYGIEVDSSATKSEKLAQVLEGLAKFSGAATAEGSTFAGQLAILKNEAENLAEEFGMILLPVLTKMIGVIRDIIAKFSGMSTEQKEAILKVMALAAAVGPVLLVFGKLVSTISALSVALKLAAGPGGWIMLAVGAFALLAISIGKAIKKNEDFNKVINGTSTETPAQQLKILEERYSKYAKEQEAFIRQTGKVNLTSPTAQDLNTMSLYGGKAGFEKEKARIEKNIKLTQDAIDKVNAKIKAEEELAKKEEQEAFALYNLTLGNGAHAAAVEESTEAAYNANVALGELNAKNIAFTGNADKAADALEKEKAKTDAAAAAQKKFRDSLTNTLSGVGNLIGALTNLATTLGVDGDAMETFGGIAQDAIAGVTAALTGNWLGIATAALGVIDKIVKWFKKGDEAAREARRTTESYMDTVTSGEGKLLKFIEIMKNMVSTMKYSIMSAFDPANMTLFKQLAADYGDNIGQTLGDAIVNGMSKVDFMAKIGEILINAMIAAALATGPIASAMAAIGEKIAYMVINGFTEEGMAEVEAMASNLYDLFSGNILPIVQKIRDMFGTSGGSEETGSFASGVTDWKGGIARVGEQGPETVRLPRGASVEPAGITRGNVSMTFNSPRALSPMEMKMQMMAASRQLAFETGGNF